MNCSEARDFYIWDFPLKTSHGDSSTQGHISADSISPSFLSLILFHLYCCLTDASMQSKGSIGTVMCTIPKTVFCVDSCVVNANWSKRPGRCSIIFWNFISPGVKQGIQRTRAAGEKVNCEYSSRSTRFNRLQCLCSHSRDRARRKKT